MERMEEAKGFDDDVHMYPYILYNRSGWPELRKCGACSIGGVSSNIRRGWYFSHPDFCLLANAKRAFAYSDWPDSH